MSHPLHGDRPELACDDVLPLLPMVADGALDHDADPALFAHLARCSDCQGELARHDLLTLALERSRPDGQRTTSRLIAFPGRRWSLVAAALVVLSVGGWFGAQAFLPAPDQTPNVEVVRVMGNDGKVRYVVREGERLRVVDPSLRERRDGDRGDAKQVNLKTWR